MLKVPTEPLLQWPIFTRKSLAGFDRKLTHWSRAYSIALAGDGTARGKIVGETTRNSGEIQSAPVSPKDVLATAYHLLGIAPHTTVNDQQDRPHPIAGAGVLRSELLA